ncbi:MAG: RsmE family RNA methyltransferase [Treponemataceae bacterium]
MRQFILQSPLNDNAEAVITGKDFKYLTHVLRLQQDDEIEVRLANGELRLMKIKKLTNKSLVLQSDDASKENHSLVVPSEGLFFAGEKAVGYGAQITLLQALTKPQKMDVIIRQATEIGVSKIIPLETEYSFRQSDSANRLLRWQRIIREARQQSGSPIDTVIEKPQNIEYSFKLIESDCGESSCRVLISEKKKFKNSIFEIFAKKPKNIYLAVGSEGGFSSLEENLFLENYFHAVHFSTNILRSETAAVYGLSVVQNLLTEFSSWQKKE